MKQRYQVNQQQPFSAKNPTTTHTSFTNMAAQTAYGQNVPSHVRPKDAASSISQNVTSAQGWHNNSFSSSQAVPVQTVTTGYNMQKSTTLDASSHRRLDQNDYQ